MSFLPSMPFQRSLPPDVDTSSVPPLSDGALTESTTTMKAKKTGKRKELSMLGIRLRNSDKQQNENVASVVFSAESSLSALLQPIFDLFPPKPSTTPLLPAFELKPSTSPKYKSIDATGDVKLKLIADEEEEEFVIHQPADWKKHKKPMTPATHAYTFDWRRDVFGDSPIAVKGQRTKYPKNPLFRPLTPRFPPARKPTSIDLGPQLGRRALGSLASMSEVSFASFGSIGSSSNFHELVTPLHDEFDPSIKQSQESSQPAEILPAAGRSHRDLSSPTQSLRERLDDLKLQIIIPIAESVHPDDDIEDEDELESPHTPSTPRSVPSDDDDD